MHHRIRTFVIMGYTLITGASRGIGADWAVEAAKAGQELVLVVRREADAVATLERIQPWASGAQPVVLTADLGQPESLAALIHQLDTLHMAGKSPDRVVNNAGFGDYAALHQADPAVLRTMVEVNVQALMHLSHWAANRLEAGGRLINVASTAAFQAGPGMAAYYASKAFVLSFSEALATELKPRNISVTAVCPGPTRTAFFDRAGLEKSRLVSQGLMPLMDAPTAVRYAFQRAEKRKFYAIPGFMNRLGTVLPRLTGRRFAAATVGWLQRPH
ncbi:MAG: SDR family NAD(P)-dependent oxidoreductase [Schleiferiaceae bacterium]|jgi:uncharacterized protein|nr:SDR family NAD(P)-dependent oxidoreductase [Schleiferiaceae bacterium]